MFIALMSMFNIPAPATPTVKPPSLSDYTIEATRTMSINPMKLINVLILYFE